MRKSLKLASSFALATFGLAISIAFYGLPPKESLAAECDHQLTQWVLTRAPDDGGLQYCIGFDIPSDYTVDVSKTEEEVRYFEIHKAGSKETLVHIYFGNHPPWPPSKRLLQKERVYGPTPNSQVFRSIDYWGIGTFQSETLIQKRDSKLEASVLANYSVRNRKNAALAEKIIRSISIKDPSA